MSLLGKKIAVFTIILFILTGIVHTQREERTFSKGRGVETVKKSERPSWWETTSCYHIYPQSFQDTSGDGLGDIRGIIQSLTYFKTLSIDCLVLSSFYTSPFDDGGNDITNFTEVSEKFGTLSDFQSLISSATDFGMKILIELVPNHSHERHIWFEDSRRRLNGRDDWYVWAKPDLITTGAPNNWYSKHGKSAWTLAPERGEYYYHRFGSFEPDLNYREPQIVQGLLDTARFWLKQGVFGFWVTGASWLIEDSKLRSEPEISDSTLLDPVEHVHTRNQKEAVNVFVQLRGLIESFHDLQTQPVLFCQVEGPHSETVQFYGTEDRPACHSVSTSLFFLEDSFVPAHIVDTNIKLLEAQGGLPLITLGSPDISRVASRDGRDSSRLLYMLALTLKGIPKIYYGDELAMVNSHVPKRMWHDPIAIEYPERVAEGSLFCRDEARSPMQWTTEPDAGFVHGLEEDERLDPWLPLNKDSEMYNVEVEKQDENSMFHFFQYFLSLRKNDPVLNLGEYVPVKVTKGQNAIAYLRVVKIDDVNEDDPTPRLLIKLIVLNFGNETNDLAFDTAGALRSLSKEEGREEWESKYLLEVSQFPEGVFLAGTHSLMKTSVPTFQATLKPREGVLITIPKDQPSLLSFESVPRFDDSTYIQLSLAEIFCVFLIAGLFPFIHGRSKGFGILPDTEESSAGETSETSAGEAP
eukprot:CAMPEP_0201479148 /NCGR_PEP_ID=MMETSP0151_2-20130828/3868_1 /ASSEMBLY_ACC=CAM_ASM_000257 /TAXON_ID=200890 /ORGANISM="Paramoeba atlantica, Strain 621/1 / CCAP 1560/9" /LENGTH=694 /DNA_ID=CAMNT_0047860499 /DNA_START=57 /DNA_END=2141 /DNA_ORIENTATION=-